MDTLLYKNLIVHIPIATLTLLSVMLIWIIKWKHIMKLKRKQRNWLALITTAMLIGYFGLIGFIILSITWIESLYYIPGK